MEVIDRCIPVKKYPDMLDVFGVYRDGAELQATYSTGEFFDDAIKVTIGWEQLAEVCATVMNNLDEVHSSKFMVLMAQRMAEAFDDLKRE